MEQFTIREIEKRDNLEVEAVIRSCLIEYGANHEGTAWADPNLNRFSEVYSTAGNKYWVAVDSSGKVVGGVGIGELPELSGICELQKMYCLPHARGTGIAQKLLDMAIEYAKQYYRQIYLETLPNMLAAHRFYEKNGFYRIPEPLLKTSHFACDVCYLLNI